MPGKPSRIPAECDVNFHASRKDYERIQLETPIIPTTRETFSIFTLTSGTWFEYRMHGGPIQIHPRSKVSSEVVQLFRNWKNEIIFYTYKGKSLRSFNNVTWKLCTFANILKML